MEGLTIGQLARKAGVHVETIRYYERRGLVAQPKKTVSGCPLLESLKEDDPSLIAIKKEASF